MSAQWDRLVESDGFQRLPPDERARVRNNYFEKVLAPRIPPEKLETALRRWDSYRPEDKRNPKAVAMLGDAGYAEAPTRSRLPVPLRADLLDDVQPGEIYNDAQGRQAVIKNGQAFPMSAGFDQSTAAPQTIARAQPEPAAPDVSEDVLRGAFGKASPDRERPASGNLATDAAMSLGVRAAMLPADLAVGTADLAARGVRGGFRAYDALGIPGAGWVAEQIKPIKDQQALQDTYVRGRRAIQDAVSRNLSLETQEQQQAVSAAMDAAADGSGSLLDMVNQVWAGASAMTNNPRALAVTVAETVPDMFVAGGFARAAAAPLFKKTYDLHVRAGFNPRAAALIAAKRTSAMATGAAAGAEATIAANMSADQAAAAIDDVSDEELAAVSPRFASLMPQVGAVEARRMMKADAMDTAAGLSAGITAVAGRLTGASSQIGKIATRGIVPETVSRSIPGAVARGVGAQGAEEFIQEGGDAFAQNRAAIDSGADPERDSMRGVMAQAGAGAVAGAALGGPIGAAGNIGTGEPLKPEPTKPRMSLREYMDIRSGKKKAAPPVAPKTEPAKPVVVEGVTLTQQTDEDGTPYWTAPGVERAFTAPEEFAEWRAEQKAEAAVTAEIKTLLEKETPSGEISPAEVVEASDGPSGDQTLGSARALPADEGRADGDGGADAGMPAPGMRPPVPVAEPKSKRAPALKTPPTGGVSRSKAPKPETAEDIEANERRYLMKMLRGTGIDIGERTDITREQPRTAARMAPGLFRKGGRTIDDVATDLYNAGYISETDFNDVDGGIQAARDLIYNAITKSEPVLSIEARDRWIALRNDEAMTAQDAADELGVDAVDALALTGRDLSGDNKPDVIDYALVEQANEVDEAAVEMAARQFENDDAAFMRAVQEIIDGRAEAARQADQVAASGAGREADARGSGQAVATGEPAASQTEVTQGPDTGAFSLAQQTEASRQKDEARVAQAEAQKQKQRQQAEVRAQSERDAADFTLTGSDRPRDVGVPAGQAEMLVDEAPRAKAAPAADAQPATEQAPTTPAKTSPGYLEDGPSVPDAKFKPGETVNARPGRTIDEAKVVRVFDREVAGMKTRVAVIERPDGKRLQVTEDELSAGRFGSPAAAEASGKQATTDSKRRPQPGENGYTLVDALNDLMEMRAQADRQGSVADDRLMSSIRQQEKLVKDMEAAAAKPSDYEKVIAKAESQIQVRSRQTGQTQWVTLRNDWTEGNRKDGSKVSVRSGGMVARVMEIDPADVVDWGSTSQGTGGKTSKKADLATRKVSENTVFTEDAAAKARELLRKKLGQINTGIDPEIMQAGITLAGYHIEKGARTFAAYAKAMVEDLGDSVKPYLKSWYMGVKFDPRAADFDGMSPSSEVEAANVDAAPTETQNAPAPEEPKRSGMDLDPGEQVIFDSFVAGLKRDGFANINQARAIYNQMRTAPESANDQKRTEELMEMAVVTVAREIAGGQRAEAEKYDALVELYGKQPNLKTRTSTSVEQQAYSTPAPLAFIASRLAGITKGTKVLEPTAGNGMLLIEASPDNAVVNELNDDRADNLRALGFNPSRRDAAEGQLRHPGYPVDAVIANPPFGAVRGDNGVMKRWQFDLPNGESIATGEIDHAITFNALKAMRPDGKAVLIVGGVSRAVKGEQARADAYHTSAAKRSFYFHLYKNYNVTDHFTVAGELYQRQGAAWPVDVIVIDGAGVSNLPLPAVEAPQVYPDWASLKEKLDGNGRVVPKQEEGAGRSNSDRGGRADQQRGLPDGPGDAAGESGRALRGSASGSGSSGRGTGSRRAVGQPGQPDAGQRGRADSQQRADVGATERSETDGQGAGQRAAQGDAGSRGSAARGSGGATRSAGGNLADKPAEVAGSATQTPYTPTSKSGAIGTLVPTNMGTAVRASLKALESRVGGVDAFVAKELGYDEKSIGQYFSAEQIDSLALALNSIKNGKGFIIGDQTGIGKGRVVAGVIRWAIRNGKTPIFVTEKPTLYSDMYRDLTDIGMQDIRPIMTNAGEKVPLDEAGNVVLTTDTAKSHGAMLSRLTADGGIGDYNVVFTTYNQMQERSGKETPQRDFLRAAADGGVVIFDESHNAGGVATGGRGGDQNEEKAGRAGFARAIAGAASGVFYSSATYAKRPDVMDLYFKTDMALAVDGDIKKLPTAIQAGGVPLQQVVATMLTKAGQYIRRERTFEGVEYQTKPVPVNRAAAEKIAQMMGAVRTFDESKKSAVEQLKKDARAEAKMISESGSVGAAGAESANFTSVMHNLIDQMLLALKVQSAADEAIAALKNGEKPVITLSNTMGSFISEYAKENDLRPGDPLPLSFADMMMRYLEKSRMVSIKDAAGRRTPKRLTDEELGANARGAYRRAEKLINESGGLGDIPVSPVDYLRQRLEDAGYKTAEITGRGDAVDYSTPGAPVYRLRGTKERSISGRRNAIAGFNNGDVDMVILNQSGSTGISLHASEKFKNQQRRRMIIAQAEKNIDTHMQMLGRVHRTGQIIAPAYTQLVADIPAEKRPAAVLAKKMASLNANTTASRDSDFTAKGVVDFLNEYGDEVVAQMMEDMPELHTELGEPLKFDDKGLIREGAARKVTGRLPLLPVADQERIYGLIESGYAEALERADAMGENSLEAKTLALDAKTLSSGTLFDAKDENSPFSAGANLETVSAKRLGKPLTSAQVIDLAGKNLGVKAETIGEIERAGREAQRVLLTEVGTEMTDYTTAEIAALSSIDAEMKSIRSRQDVLQSAAAQFKSRMGQISIGAQYAVQIPDQGTIYGVVVDVKRKKGVKLPVALGSWNVTIALADGARMLTVPLSKMGSGEGKISLMPASRDGSGESVMSLFDSGQTQSREERIIATGNLLAAFSRLGKGQIVTFTRDDGELEQGILMPKSFSVDAFVSSQPVILKGSLVTRLIDAEPGAIVKSVNGEVEIRRAGSARYVISVPQSKAGGGKYFLDRGLRGIVGDFSSAGKEMRVSVDDVKLAQAVIHMEEKMGQKFGTSAYRDTALALGGEPAVSLSPGEVRERGREYDPSGMQADLFDGYSKGDARPGAQKMAVARYATEAVLTPVREVTIGTGTVNGAYDLAKASVPLARKAVENLQGILTDANGKVLSVIGNFKGDRSLASVFQFTLMGEAMGTEGATNLWLTHNHPSGVSSLSQADRRVLQLTADKFSGTKITVRGIMAIGGRDFEFVAPDGETVRGTANPPRLTQVTVPERELTRTDKLGAVISSPEVATAAARSIAGKQPGIILLNGQHEPVAFVPWAPERASRLRGTGGLDDLYEAAVRANASAALIASPEGSYTPGQETNLARALKTGAVEVNVLDVIRYTDTTSESLAGSGRLDNFGPFYSRSGQSRPATGNRNPAPEWETAQVDKLNGILARQAGQEVPLRAVETPKAMRGMSEMLETLLGRKAVFFESNDPRAPAGVYVSGGVLFVNADALQPLRHVLGHEFTHSLEGPAAELHAILKARILEMAKDGAFPAYEARLEKVYQRDGLTKLSRAKVENEFVADVMGSVMSDPKVLFDLKQRMEPNAFKRLMNRLRFWIEKMMSRLRREDMRQSQFAQRTMRDLQSVKTLVADVLQATAEGQLRPSMGDTAPAFSGEGQTAGETFYSALTRAVEQAKQNKGPGAQWKSWLKNQNGIKQEEIEWSGVIEWLDQQKGSVTKESLAEFLRQNEVQVEETILGQRNDRAVDTVTDEYASAIEAAGATPSDARMMAEAIREWAQESFSGREDAVSAEIIREKDRGYDFLKAAMDAGTISGNEIHDEVSDAYRSFDPPRYAGYQTPGGENYRELLLTLPVKKVQAAADDRDSLFYAGSNEEPPAAGVRSMVDDEKSTYHSGHFDEPNILAHVRFNERTDAEGKRVLFIEEVQSDWHQEGRKKGYAGPEGKWEAIQKDDGTWWVRQPDGQLSNRDFDRETAQRLARAGNQSRVDVGSIPDAPFKQSWPMLAMKRMIRYAAENGFDRIAWTPSEIQAKRYNEQVEQVKHIAWEKNDDGTYNIAAPKRDGSPGVYKEDLSEQELVALVGKDIAGKIDKGEGRDDTDAPLRDWKIIDGEGLKIGGQAFAAFYDRELRNEVGKYVKKWGAKVGTAGINPDAKKAAFRTQAEAETFAKRDADWAAVEHQRSGWWFVQRNGGRGLVVSLDPTSTPVHSVDVTPQMRDAALSGQPMFARDQNPPDGGFSDSGAALSRRQTETPEFKRWFGDSKVVDADGEPLVVYHGSSETSISKFESEDGRFYFTDSKAVANGYGRKIGERKNAATYSAYLNMARPDVYDMQGASWHDDGVGTEVYGYIRDAKEAGFDGVILENFADGATARTAKPSTVYVVFTPEQIKSATGNNGNFDPEDPRISFSRRGQTDPDDANGLMTETLGKETVGQKLYRNVLNRFSEVERAVKFLKGKGVAIPDERDPGSLEKTFYGRTQTRLDDLKDTTKALFKVMNKAGVSFKQASDYLYALHAEERNAAIAERRSRFPDGGSGMTNRQAKKILAEVAALPQEQRDALDEVSRVVQAINRQKLNLMREAGLISAQQYQDLTTGYQHYVPLKSVVDPEEEGHGTGNGFDQRSTVIREAYGRASRAEDPLAVALLDAQKTFVRAEKNRVGRAVYNLILETSGEQGLISGPAGDYWRVLTPEEYPKQARKVQVPVIDSKTGRPKKDTKGRIVTTEDVQYVPNMNDLYRRDEIFMARVDGNLVVMEFQNKQLARQLKNMAGEQLTGVLRGMSVATKFFGRLLTQYNPEFAVPNFIRDVQTAYLNAFGADMEDPKGFAFDVMKSLRKGAASSFKGKKDPLYREFLEAGGATGAYGLTGVDDIKAEYEKLVERQRKGISPGVVMEAGKKFIEKVERFNEVFENTTRLAIYKAARDRGLSKQESARLAKDTTVNFNQKGEQQWPGALYVFFNAAMQGNIAMLKAAARSKVTQSAMAGLMIFGLLESLAEGDDDEGEPMGDAAGKWALGREFTAFLDDNTFIKVPLAYGYNVPYAMGRMLGRSIKGNASPAEAIGTSLSTFMTSFVPTDTLVPTIAEPFLSVLNNETAFDSTIYRRSFGDDTFDPIAYRDYEEKRLTGLMQMLHQLAGGDRYEPNVIKEATGFDPFSASGAEALVKGYVGPQFRLAMGVAGLLAAAGKGLAGELTADDVPDLNELPVTRRFVNERPSFFYDSRFGDITREADAARKTIESMRESRTPISDRYTPEQVRAVNNTRLFAAYDRKLRKAIDMTPDETRKAELEARRAKLVKDSIRRYNEAFE